MHLCRVLTCPNAQAFINRVYPDSHARHSPLSASQVMCCLVVHYCALCALCLRDLPVPGAVTAFLKRCFDVFLITEASSVPALKLTRWICYVVERLPGDVERNALCGFDGDTALAAPWTRLLRLDGVRSTATKSDVLAACSKFGRVVDVYRKMQV